MKILFINGPNINMLGIREPEIYGEQTFKDLEVYIRNFCRELDVECELYQSNVEGFIVDRIQQAYFEHADGIVINPAAYTHTSVAILDAVKAVNIPTVEVHISEVNSREDFRKVSFVSKAAIKTISGMGFKGYEEACKFLLSYIGR